MNVGPNFEEAVRSFEEFIGENSYPPHVVWVRAQEVAVAPHRRLFVRDPTALDNEEHARATFAAGMQNEMGVLFSTLCELGGVTCCYVWTPVNEHEAGKILMPRGLKMSATSAESRLHGKAMKNALMWRWLRWKHRKRQQYKDWLFQ
jgi:hypothetical protein